MRSSLLGSFQADMNVGMEPRNTTERLVTMPRTGLLNACQRAMPRTAPPRQNLSSRVHPGVPYLRVSTATVHAPSIAPRIWPLTASLEYMPAMVMLSRLAQMTQDAFAGFVSPRTIAQMYGTKAAMNNRPATIERTLLIGTVALLCREFLDDLIIP